MSESSTGRLAKLGHDLRSPLQALQFVAQKLLLKVAPEAEIRRDVERLKGLVARATSVIDEQLEPLIEPEVAPAPEADAALPALAGSGPSVLLVEDSAEQARELLDALADAAPGEFAVRHVTSVAGALHALATERIDIVLLDLYLPDSQGLDSVAAVREVAPNIPVVVLTGTNDRTTALEAVRRGAQDFLVKSVATGESVSRALFYARERAALLAERDRLFAELESAIGTVKRLSGLLPICASCKRIRDEDGGWQPVERYIDARSDASFTHTYCDECARRAVEGL